MMACAGPGVEPPPRPSRSALFPIVAAIQGTTADGTIVVYGLRVLVVSTSQRTPPDDETVVRLVRASATKTGEWFGTAPDLVSASRVGVPDAMQVALGLELSDPRFRIHFTAVDWVVRNRARLTSALCPSSAQRLVRVDRASTVAVCVPLAAAAELPRVALAPSASTVGGT